MQLWRRSLARTFWCVRSPLTGLLTSLRCILGNSGDVRPLPSTLQRGWLSRVLPSPKRSATSGRPLDVASPKRRREPRKPHHLKQTNVLHDGGWLLPLLIFLLLP